jgi:hypothetical protein
MPTCVPRVRNRAGTGTAAGGEVARATGDEAPTVAHVHRRSGHGEGARWWGGAFAAEERVA